FGFHRAMDNLGAVLGPLLAALILWQHPDALRTVFALSIVPGGLAVLAIVALVRDVIPPARADLTPQANVQHAQLGPDFRRYLSVVGIFTLANVSDFFLIPKALSAGISVRSVPLLWGGLSLLRAIAATPGGWVADRIGRRQALALGWGLYALAYASLALAHS